MHADVKGALAQIDKSWKAFTHNDKPMTKEQVRAVLQYAIGKGYDSTGQLSDEEIDHILFGKIKLPYDTAVEVSKADYDYIKVNFAGYVAHCEENGRYYIKNWLPKYIAEVENYLNRKIN
jgi:hypothetical protein